MTKPLQDLDLGRHRLLITSAMTEELMRGDGFRVALMGEILGSKSHTVGEKFELNYFIREHDVPNFEEEGGMVRVMTMSGHFAASRLKAFALAAYEGCQHESRAKTMEDLMVKLEQGKTQHIVDVEVTRAKPLAKPFAGYRVQTIRSWHPIPHKVVDGVASLVLEIA